MFGYSIPSLFKCFVCTTALYLHADKNKIPCLYSAGAREIDMNTTLFWCVPSLERQRGWAIRRGNWGLRRQFLEEQDAWACSTSRKHEWKRSVCLWIEKNARSEEYMEEYFRLRNTQFSLLFTILKMWFFLQRELTSQMLQQVYLCVEVITIYNKTNIVIAFITSVHFLYSFWVSLD